MNSILQTLLIILGALWAVSTPCFLMAQNSGKDLRNTNRQIGAPSQQIQGQRARLETVLEVENFHCSKQQANDGDKITVEFRVKNLGDTNIKQVPYELFFYGRWRINNHTRQTNDYEKQLDAGFLNDIQRGSWVDYKKELIVPWNIRPDQVEKIEEIKIIVGRRAHGPERTLADVVYSSESLPFSATVLKRPDLTITNMEQRGAHIWVRGAKFYVDLTLKNIGSRSSIPSTYKVNFKIYDSNYTAPRQGGRMSPRGRETSSRHRPDHYRPIAEKQGRVPPLRPNQSKQITVEFSRPFEIARQGFSLSAIADAGSNNFEADESNNGSKIVWNNQQSRENRPQGPSRERK